MLGMGLLSFLILTIIGAVVAVAYHDVVRYRFLDRCAIEKAGPAATKEA